MDRRLTAWLMLTALLTTQALVSAAPLPQPIVTSKTRFRIPFKVEPSSLQRLNARELQLHVSRDRGVNWELAQTLQPDGSKFEYQANLDGEYWFAVKTVDGRGQLHPAIGTYETGLIVVVDTTAPLLDLTLQQLAPGKVQLSWNAADANLDPSTLKIEYTQPGTQEWEPVDVTPKASGQMSWNVFRQGQMSVRGTIADTAANIGRGQSQIMIAAGDPPPKPKSNRRVPIAELDEGQEQAAISPPNIPPAMSTPGKPSRSNPALPGMNPPDETAGTTDFRGPVITPFGTGVPNSAGRGGDHFVSSDPNARPEITRDRWSNDPEPFAPSPAPQPRANGQRRIVNSRRFQVGYAVDDVGPSGIGAVELFITQDNGRKWWKYGDDPDRRSPFDVEVPQDGEYGFAIRVRSGAGLTNDPPIPGEPPAIVVAVDQTPPTVEILSAQQGQGSSSNRVQIRWRISDEHLANKPVCVYYSTSRGGPWETLSGWKDDTGGFEWNISPGSPPQFFVRVVARDTAGNTAKAESAQAILVDLARPTARIVDVESPQSIGPQ
jgi:hypothetical protein